MHVVWKRPDGFHGAAPTDYEVFNLGGHSKLWLHRSDHSHYPFRIAGGWQESEATKRLNNLVNLLPKKDPDWLSTLQSLFNDTMADDAGKFIDDLIGWIIDLKQHLKGDTWELEIMTQAVEEVAERLKDVRPAFLKAAHT